MTADSRDATTRTRKILEDLEAVRENQVPHASQGGKVETTTLSCLKRHQPVFTLDNAENECLTSIGALTYSLESVAIRLRGPAGTAW